MTDITTFPIQTEVLDPANYPAFQGNPGVDGKNIELRVDSGFIQWRQTGDVAWQNLVEVSSLAVIGDASIYVGPTPPADTSLLWVDNSE